LVEVIKQFETLKLTMIESLAIKEKAEIKLNELRGEFRVIIKNKLNNVFGNNVGLQRN
jgi:hypothetical protein